MYARNVSALLLYLIKDGELALDPEDELQAGVIVTSGGAIVPPALALRRLRTGQSSHPRQKSSDLPEEGAARVVPGAAR